MVKIDSLDKRLLKMLEEDGTRSSEVIAKQLEISSATVRRRLRNLTRSGVVRIVGIVEPTKVGLPLATVIGLNVVEGKSESVVQELANLTEVKWVSSTSGSFDIIALVRLSSTEELHKFVQNTLSRIKGVKDHEEFICMGIRQARY